MTLSRRVLKRINSPLKSPKLTNSSVRKRALLRRLSSGVQFGGTSKANLKVVVRVRPENQREHDSNARSVIDIMDGHMLVFDPNPEEEDFFFQGQKQKFRDLSKKQHKEQKFIFERVFDPSSTNEDIFDTTTKDIVDNILNGYNCSVFAYGATGSGKTHTMIGNDASPGIIFLTVMELYKKIAEVEATKICEVGVSYLEVYNEHVRDLLVPGKPLNLYETGQHVQVTGLTLHKPKDADELLKILAEGNRNRSQHPTDANAESSRSHAVFQVFVRQQDHASQEIKSSVSIAKLSMIDLAGSERGAVTGFRGARFREGSNINKSLLALGNCINALADAKGHIPYRDSKLTRLLKDSIGGNCRSVMIATVTRSSLSFEDTFNTLRYANRAKTIKTTLKKNLLNVDQHVSQYLKVMEELKAEISVLKERLKQSEENKVKEPPVECEKRLSNDEREMYEEAIQTLRKQLEEDSAKAEKETRAQKDFLETLMERNGELKNYQREILQLETKERELELKMFLYRLRIIRMKVFAFASSKLEKGIAKSERSIESFQNHLDHILKRKDFLNSKLSNSKEKLVGLCEEFKRSSSFDVNSEEAPDFLIKKLKQNELEQSLRNTQQINEYLQNLVQQLLSNQTNNEKLLALLLIVTKNLYLRLRSVDRCDAEAEEMLNKIYGMLDASRIEWADLKNTDNSFGEQSVSKHITLEPTIDCNKLTQFPVIQGNGLSPIVTDVSKVYKRSNIKKDPSEMVGASANAWQVKCETIQEESTPVSQRKFECTTSQHTPVSLSGSLLDDSPSLTSDVSKPKISENISQKSVTMGFASSTTAAVVESSYVTPPTREIVLPPQGLTPVTPVVCLPTYEKTAHTGASRWISSIPEVTPSPQEVGLSIQQEMRDSHNLNPNDTHVRKDLFGSDTPPLERTLSDEQTAVIATDSTAAEVQKTTKTVPSPQGLNVTITLCHESEEQGTTTRTTAVSTGTLKAVDDTLPTTVSTETVVNPVYDIRPPAVSIETSENEVDHTSYRSTGTLESNTLDCNRTITLSSADHENESEEGEKTDAQRVADSTFSVGANDQNGTFCIPSGASGFYIDDTSQKILRVVPPSSVRNKDNLNPPKLFKKPRSPAIGITPSKVSYTRLPPATSKLHFKSGFKRCVSVPSLQTGSTVKPSQPHHRGLENSMKKSVSFLKPKMGSTHKNQENLPPKAVAFGSSYSNSQRGAISKRSLAFHPSVPPEQ